MRGLISSLLFGVCCFLLPTFHSANLFGAPASLCGDGITDGSEMCDDGGVCDNGTTHCTTASASTDCAGIGSGQCTPRSNDGCDDNCQVENGFTCDSTVSPSVCSDVNECYDRTDDCGQYALCTNTVGGFTCACRPGYLGDGYVCTDTNECTDPDLNDCSVHGRCINYSGGYNCACNAGFIGDGRTCSDIDECSFNTDNCDDTATCTNTVGSYTCDCPSGYAGDGRRIGTGCVDVDECLDGIDNCTVTNGGCQNLDGGFECFCDPGFVGDGTVDGSGCSGDADLAVTNFATTSSASVAGQAAPLTLELTFTNHGPVDATGVHVMFDLSASAGATFLQANLSCSSQGMTVTCAGSTPGGMNLLVDETVTAQFEVSVQSVVNAGPLVVTATVTGNETDANSGDNTMTVTVDLTATCSDGVVNGAEQCDDGNTENGDGCGATCRFENGACCMSGECVQATEDNCHLADGEFFGAGTSCDETRENTDEPMYTCDACSGGLGADADADGLCGVVDRCPEENPQGLDADADGCVDRLEYLDDVLAGLDISRSVKHTLLQKVKQAQAAFRRGQLYAVKGNLRALVNMIRAKSGKGICREDARMLLMYIKNVRLQLQGYQDSQ